ncbi:MAG: mismatch repair protein MutT [Bacteroidetes bacterium]|nr:mismatch repair protein MutT [Bacteroidota bacterium]
MKKRFKRELIYGIVFTLLLLGLFLILRVQIPAVQKRIFVFAIWFFAEIYLWFTIVRAFQLFKNYKEKRKIRIIGECLLTAFYWLPALMVGLAALSLAKNSVHGINTTLYLTIMGSSVIQYLIKFVLFCLIIPFDLISWIIKKLKKEKVKFYAKVRKWRAIMLKSAFYLYLIGFILMGYGMIFVAEEFVTREIKLETNNPIFKENPTKIVLISDIHLATWRSEKPVKEIISKVNQLDPDYIFFGGDLVQFTSKEMDPYLSLLKTLKAKKGIYSVLGNHDYATYAHFDNENDQNNDVLRLVNLQEQMGWHVLRNESERIVVDSLGRSFVIAGIEFYSPTKMFINKGNIEQTYQNIKKEDFVLLLSHSPEIWDSLKVKNLPAFLTVSGHTHGMQIGYYGTKHKWSPGSLLYKYWGGLYQDARASAKNIYVNVGLASIGFPSRIGMHPEITIIHLQ